MFGVVSWLCVYVIWWVLGFTAPCWVWCVVSGLFVELIVVSCSCCFACLLLAWVLAFVMVVAVADLLPLFRIFGWMRAFGVWL